MGSTATESLQVLERCRLQAPHSSNLVPLSLGSPQVLQLLPAPYSSNLVPLSLGPPQVLLLLPHLVQWEQLLSEVQHSLWPALE